MADGSPVKNFLSLVRLYTADGVEVAEKLAIRHLQDSVTSHAGLAQIAIDALLKLATISGESAKVEAIQAQLHLDRIIPTNVILAFPLDAGDNVAENVESTNFLIR